MPSLISNTIHPLLSDEIAFISYDACPPQTERSDARAINGQDLIDWLTNIMMGPALSAGEEELSQLPTARNFFLCPASHFFSVSLSLISSLSHAVPQFGWKRPRPLVLFVVGKLCDWWQFSQKDNLSISQRFLAAHVDYLSTLFAHDLNFILRTPF